MQRLAVDEDRTRRRQARRPAVPQGLPQVDRSAEHRRPRLRGKDGDSVLQRAVREHLEGKLPPHGVDEIALESVGAAAPDHRTLPDPVRRRQQRRQADAAAGPGGFHADSAQAAEPCASRLAAVQVAQQRRLLALDQRRAHQIAAPPALDAVAAADVRDPQRLVALILPSDAAEHQGLAGHEFKRLDDLHADIRAVEPARPNERGRAVRARRHGGADGARGRTEVQKAHVRGIAELDPATVRPVNPEVQLAAADERRVVGARGGEREIPPVRAEDRADHAVIESGGVRSRAGRRDRRPRRADEEVESRGRRQGCVDAKDVPAVLLRHRMGRRGRAVRAPDRQRRVRRRPEPCTQGRRIQRDRRRMHGGVRVVDQRHMDARRLRKLRRRRTGKPDSRQPAGRCNRFHGIHAVQYVRFPVIRHVSD